MQSISHGSVGRAVADVQAKLEALGYSCAGDETAVFGAATEAAVRGFQRSRGLTADGVVGADSWGALVAASHRLGDRLLYLRHPMLHGDDVRELQRRLSQLGFPAGREDGVLGVATADGIREFQLNRGLPVDGIAGAATIDDLRRLWRQHQSEPAAAVREREALRGSPGRPSIAGARVLVDAGHGPDDPGITGVDGRHEHEVAWAIASRLAGRLAARGARIYLARGPRTTPSDSDRARLANAERVEAILSVHANSARSTEARGAAAYYFGHESFVSEAGRLLAELAVDQVCARVGTPNCRTHASTTTLLRESLAPAVIVEPGFLTHPDEGRRLLDAGYQSSVADALTDALVTFLTGPTVMEAA